LINYFTEGREEYAAAIQVATFATFVLNKFEMFKEPTDIHALLLGYISISYLGMIFLSLNWQTSVSC
jgi:putative flippase GtrA